MQKIPPHKHIVQTMQTGLNLSANNTLIIAKGVLNPDPFANSNNVRAGSIIKKITIALDWVNYAETVQADSFEWYVWFNVNGAQTQPDPTTTNASHLKNQIIHQDGTFQYYQGATVPNSFNMLPVNKWRIVINVPRWAQQLNDGDQLEIVVRTLQNNGGSVLRSCVIYKEIYP